METKELKISVPQGYEIDKENSTFECIKFKKIEQKKWRDNKEVVVLGYYINSNSNIIQIKDGSGCNNANEDFNHNIFATKKQAKSALAMAQISQIMANDERFGGIITDEEWVNNYRKNVIYRNKNGINIGTVLNEYKFLAFHTNEQRNLFLQENGDLIKDYLMID